MVSSTCRPVTCATPCLSLHRGDGFCNNFLSSLVEEAFFTKEADCKLYSKSMHRIKVQAKALGAEVPSGYVRAAKANAKRRAKQDVFLVAKLEAAAASGIAEA
jgi:hypothetical protein